MRWDSIRAYHLRLSTLCPSRSKVRWSAMTIAPITTLSPSGEVARFIDDDQFNWGLESTMKCGPEAVSLFWHSLPPGQANPYKAADIHAMAHNDYVKFVGSDVPSDQG